MTTSIAVAGKSQPPAPGILKWTVGIVAMWMWRRLGSYLRTGDEACTMDRLLKSIHVKDLQLLVIIALGSVFLVLVLGLAMAIGTELMTNWDNHQFSMTWEFWSFVTKWVFLGTKSFLTIFGPVLAILGAILTWAYQVGSARLGVVDLFACEISTLCRVITVFDAVQRYIDGFNESPTVKPEDVKLEPRPQFSSQENYFPVFDSSTKDLQMLEARVVINITAFYTYMKALRDSLRRRDAIPPPAPGPICKTDPWHVATHNVIYMMFLGLESARHAITDLVEFEPENAERRIVILMSELDAYGFLRREYEEDKTDVHFQRITLREPEYLKLVPQLCQDVRNGRDGADPETSQHPEVWEPALRLLPELERRFSDAVRA
jgi:hypothetical protein